MTITERAAKALKQIDAALALTEKEPHWAWDNELGLTLNGSQFLQILNNGNKAQRQRTGAFIAASRTLLPTSLRCLKTSIEDWLNLAFTMPFREMAFDRLTTLCDQWEAGR